MSALRYLSVCSGIEAASAAWHPLGFQPVAFSEIDPFPCAVLAHHYPTVANWGDMTAFKGWPDADIDLLVGGTPCQSFSVAGLRKGLADPRGNLALTFLAIADRYRPRWVVWENVPGVLSSDSHVAPDPRPPAIDLDGRDAPEDGQEVLETDEYDADEVHAFACLLAGFSELGYFGAYGTLDAQYFDLAQRRARVFAVFHLGDWRRAAAVLFERESLSGHPAPRREAGQGVAAGTLRSTDGGLDCDHAAASRLVNERTNVPPLSLCLNAGAMGRIDAESETLIPTGGSFDVAHALRADGFDASEDGTGRGTLLVPIAFSAKDHGADAGDTAPTLRAGGFTNSHANGGVMPAVAFDTTQMTSKANRSHPKPGDPCHPLAAGAHPPAVAFDARQSDVIQYGDLSGPLDTDGHTIGVQSRMQVRRLTPREAERLQGFPDGYTRIPMRTYKHRRITKTRPADRWEPNADGTWTLMAADGPRYKALGNSMAVPVMRWIGQRIQLVDTLCTEQEQTTTMPKRHTEAVQHSSKEPGWRTPPPLFAQLDREFNFILDAAASKQDKLCPHYFGPDHTQPTLCDALQVDWHQYLYEMYYDGQNHWLPRLATFVNPPYSTELANAWSTGRIKQGDQWVEHPQDPAKADSYRIGCWVEKCWREAQRGLTIVGVIPYAPQTEWWRKWVCGHAPAEGLLTHFFAAREIRKIPHRVTFLRPDGSVESSAGGNTAIVVWKAQHGLVAPWTPLDVYWDYL